MLVLEENVGSSWRLKADFDESFTFLSCFAGLPGLLEARGNLHLWVSRPKMGPKLAFVFLIFAPVWGPFREPVWGQNQLRSAKVGPRRTSRASEYRKTTFAKTIIFQLENKTFRVLGAFKTSIRRSRRLSRGSWKTPKPQKTNPEMDRILTNCWFHFRAILWPVWGPQKVAKNGVQHVTKNGTRFGTACSVSQRSASWQNLLERYQVARNSPSKRKEGILKASNAV